MKRLTLAVLAGLVLGGCRDEIPTAGQAKTGAVPKYFPTTNTYELSPDAKTVMKRTCFQCHSITQPDGQGWPAGVKIIPGSPWTIQVPGDAQDIHEAIAHEFAPANRALTEGEMDTLTLWTVYDLGAEPDEYSIPTTFDWNQNSHQSECTIPGSGYQPGGYFGFSVEALLRPNLNILEWEEEDNVSGRSKYTKNVLAMSWYTAVPYDSFHASDDATMYVSPSGIPFNGRLRTTTMKGYFQYRKRFFAMMHVQTDREGPTNTTRRNSRTYVRLQVEDSGKLGLRMKKEGFTDELETVGAWEGAAGPSDLVNDTGAGLNLLASGISGINQLGRFYWLEFTATEDANGTHYVGKLYTDKPSLGGTLKATVGGLRANKTKAFGGFGWGWYERLGADRWNRMADWEVTASSMEGGGGTTGGCRQCELDR